MTDIKKYIGENIMFGDMNQQQIVNLYIELSNAKQKIIDNYPNIASIATQKLYNKKYRKCDVCGCQVINGSWYKHKNTKKHQDNLSNMKD